MAKTLQREIARKIRKQGHSIGYIAQKMKVSKSTASYWCRDIVLLPSQIQNLQERQKTASLKALLLNAEKKRKERLKREESLMNLGKREMGTVSRRDLFIAGLSLYWAEGYKKGNSELGFTNSDPIIIKLIIKWLRTFYYVKSRDLILRVSINEIHELRMKKILNYWSRTTKVPIVQFTKTSLIKTKIQKKYLNTNNYFGTLRVKVRRGSRLRKRIMGAINALGERLETTPNVSLSEID